MENPQAVLWQLEGELLQTAVSCDKLKKQGELTPEEAEKLADLEKRRDILAKRLRKVRMGA